MNAARAARTSAVRGDPELERRVRWRLGIKYLPISILLLLRGNTYFVGARIGMAGTDGIKCSAIAFANCVDRVDKLEELMAGYA
jgi:hypothetical protein